MTKFRHYIASLAQIWAKVCNDLRENEGLPAGLATVELEAVNDAAVVEAVHGEGELAVLAAEDGRVTEH